MTAEQQREITLKQVDKAPRFNFAIYSKRDGTNAIELESSADSLTDAQRLFSEYKKWGMDNTRFTLIDWAEQKVIDTFKFAKVVQP